MSEGKADTVPGLGFKDQEKAQETLKILEGRDPDYQKLAIKGLLGRAKRTLTVTKDKDKLQNINEAVEVFESWLKNFENKNLSKENRAYLPLNAIEALLPLRNKYKINDKKAEEFLVAYTKVKGEYKNLRTITSGENEPTWDIVRNKALKPLLKEIDDKNPDMWDDDLPTKSHMELILWGYSPEATKIKKSVSKFEEKLGTKKEKKYDSDDSDDEEDTKRKKRKSSSDENDDDESPKKKNRN